MNGQKGPPYFSLAVHGELLGEHVHARFFMGPNRGARALLGTLVMDVGQWQILGAALGLGAKQTMGHLEFECPHDPLCPDDRSPGADQ